MTLSRLYLDTEFNGFGSSLISLGLASECGKEFYTVVEIPDEPHPWIKAHVLPLLDDPPVGYATARESCINS